MKKILPIVLVVVLMATLIPGVALADPDTRGNGLPKGKSYNFNVIGVPNQKNANFDGGEGKRIFILRDGTTRFYVHGDPAGSFSIEDRDGTDGKVGDSRAEPGIILPYDAIAKRWDCKVYVRLLGPVDSSFKWKSEYWDGSAWALIAEFTLDRSSKFQMKNSQILADGFQDVLWTWSEKDNFRICQFRIFVGAPE